MLSFIKHVISNYLHSWKYQIEVGILFFSIQGKQY